MRTSHTTILATLLSLASQAQLVSLAQAQPTDNADSENDDGKEKQASEEKTSAATEAGTNTAASQATPAASAPAAPATAAPAVAETAAPAVAETAAPAEEVNTGDTQSAADANEMLELEQIVVTVDQRRKNIQDYSGTADSFSQEQLTQPGVNSVDGLSALMPGLQVGSQEGASEVFLRGIGSDNNTELGDPAVAMHIDGIYVPRPRGVGAMFFDLERVEVNSGPQGTLRGRNAMGGSINLVTAKPRLGEFSAFGEAQFGNYSSRIHRGMVNIPLGETLAVRVATFSEVHEPYYKNGGPIWDLDPAESADTLAARAQVKWEPSDAFTAEIGYDYLQERGTGSLGSNVQDVFVNNDADGNPNPIPVEDIDDPRRVYYRGHQSKMDSTHQGARASFQYDAGPAVFELLGGLRRLDFEQANGSNAGVIHPGFKFDEAEADRFGTSFWEANSTAYIGELRAFAPDSAQIRWNAGLFALYEDQQAFLGQTNDPGTFYGGGEFNMPDVKSTSLAAYADVTADVATDLRVIAGVRATRETKSRKNGLWSQWGFDFDGGRFGTEGFRYKGLDRGIADTSANPVDVFLDGIESFGIRDDVPAAICNPAAEGERILTANGRCREGTQDGVALRPNELIAQNAETEALYVDWRAGVEYDLAPDSLLYATASTGHRAGGFNDTINSPDGQSLFNSEYDPESLIAFEVGSKNLLFDRNLRLNAAGFAYLYDDQVFQTNVATGEDPEPNNPDTTAPTSALRQNAASTTVLGLEVDLSYRLPYNLQVDFNALLMDASFGDDAQITDTRIGWGVQDYEVNLGGKKLPRSSPLAMNYGLSQTIESDVGTFDWIVSGQTKLKHFMTVFNGEGQLLPRANGPEPDETDADGNLTDYGRTKENPARLEDRVPTYTRLDLGMGWQHPSGRLAISGYVNNVTQTTYVTSLISNPGLNLRFYNAPRTYGARVRVDW